jgi:hypothetical protein
LQIFPRSEIVANTYGIVKILGNKSTLIVIRSFGSSDGADIDIVGFSKGHILVTEGILNRFGPEQDFFMGAFRVPVVVIILILDIRSVVTVRI